jgi:hypothetical protein
MDGMNYVLLVRVNRPEHRLLATLLYQGPDGDYVACSTPRPGNAFVLHTDTLELPLLATAPQSGRWGGWRWLLWPLAMLWVVIMTVAGGSEGMK